MRYPELGTDEDDDIGTLDMEFFEGEPSEQDLIDCDNRERAADMNEEVNKGEY